MTIGEYTINELVGFIVAISVAIVAIQKLADWGIGLFNKLHKRKNNEESMENMVKRHDIAINEIVQYQKFMGCGIKEILKIFLQKKYEEIIKQGFIYIDQLEEFTEMYRPYEGLGGNGTVKTMYNELLTLEKHNR